MKKLAAALLTATLLTACASNNADWERLPMPTVIPVSSLVIPYDDNTEREPWVDHATAVMRGRDVHDDVRRRPSGATGNIRVDCQATKLLGIAFLYERVDTSGPGPRIREFGIAGTTSLRFQWRHSGFDPQGEKYDRLLPESRLMRTRTDGRFFFSALALEENDRVNGSWTVAVRRDGELLYEESFLLEDCGDPDQAGNQEDI